MQQGGQDRRKADQNNEDHTAAAVMYFCKYEVGKKRESKGGEEAPNAAGWWGSKSCRAKVATCRCHKSRRK